jgi:hypothetical protein
MNLEDDLKIVMVLALAGCLLLLSLLVRQHHPGKDASLQEYTVCFLNCSLGAYGNPMRICIYSPAVINESGEYRRFYSKCAGTEDKR